MPPRCWPSTACRRCRSACWARQARTFTAKGTLGGGLATSFSLAGDDFKAGFEGTVADTPQGLAAKGKLSLDAADIEPWLMTSASACRAWGRASRRRSRRRAIWQRSAGAGRTQRRHQRGGGVGDVNVDVKEGVDGKDGVPHLAGALALDELDLDPMAVALFGDQPFLLTGLIGRAGRRHRSARNPACRSPPTST